jgi:tetratricopeptide (TPR) repeat protein
MLGAFDGAEPSPAHARLYAALAGLLRFTGRYEDVLTALDRGVELARTLGDEAILAEARFWQGVALRELGRTDEARRALEDAAELMERLGAGKELGDALANLGHTYLVLGELQRTRRLQERVLALAEQVGHPVMTAQALVSLAEVHFYLGDWAAVRAHAERAAGIHAASDSGWYTAYPPLWLGIVALAEGRWDEGDRHMARCLAVAEQHEYPLARREAHRWLAERDLLLGQPRAALARLLPLLDRPGLEEDDVTRLLPSLGSVYLELGEKDRAEDTVTKGLERASRQSHRLALVDLLRLQGVLHTRQDHWEEAERAFAEAVALARTMAYPYAEARALYEWGRMHGTRGESVPAKERFEEASRIFRQLGARPYVERAEQALAAPR